MNRRYNVLDKASTPWPLSSRCWLVSWSTTCQGVCLDFTDKDHNFFLQKSCPSKVLIHQGKSAYYLDYVLSVLSNVRTIWVYCSSISYTIDIYGYICVISVTAKIGMYRVEIHCKLEAILSCSRNSVTISSIIWDKRGLATFLTGVWENYRTDFAFFGLICYRTVGLQVIC